MAGIAVIKDNTRLFMGLMSDFKDGGATGNAFTKLTKTIALAVTPVIITPPAQAGDPDYKVANVSSIAELGGEAEDIDTTCLDSEAKEAEAGFVDNGTQDVTFNITDEKVYSNLKKWQDNAADIIVCQARYSKTGKRIAGIMYQGIIKSAKLSEASVGGLMQVSASIKLSGAIYDVVTALSDLPAPAAGDASPHTVKDAVFQ